MNVSTEKSPAIVTRDLSLIAGRAVKAAREAQGLSLAELSRRIARLCDMEIPSNRIGDFESGERRMNLDHLAAIAAGLGVAATDLLQDGPTTEQPSEEQLVVYAFRTGGLRGLIAYAASRLPG